MRAGVARGASSTLLTIARSGSVRTTSQNPTSTLLFIYTLQEADDATLWFCSALSVTAWRSRTDQTTRARTFFRESTNGTRSQRNPFCASGGSSRASSKRTRAPRPIPDRTAMTERDARQRTRRGAQPRIQDLPAPVSALDTCGSVQGQRLAARFHLRELCHPQNPSEYKPKVIFIFT